MSLGLSLLLQAATSAVKATRARIVLLLLTCTPFAPVAARMFARSPRRFKPLCRSAPRSTAAHRAGAHSGAAPRFPIVVGALDEPLVRSGDLWKKPALALLRFAR
jgi:hypothetical protein